MDQQPQIRSRIRQRSIAGLVGLAAVTLAVSPVLAAEPSLSTESTVRTGPSTSTSPYVLPVADGVRITSVLTVADSGAAGNGYEMVGIPDGLGLSRQNGRTVLFMNHELRDQPDRPQGIVRRHGEIGAFVSRLVINPRTLKVTHGSDLIDPGVRFWDYPNGEYVTTGPRFADLAEQQTSFGRFCSGTLSDPGVFFNERTGRGYHGQLWFANEEDGDNGRTFGVTTDGRATALPRHGLFSWENTVPADNRSDTTLVMGQEDGPGDGSQLWAYVGTKQRNGSAVRRAGLTNGLNYAFDAADPAITTDAEWRAANPRGVSGAVSLVNIPWSQTGAAQAEQAQAQALNLNRIEDGHWDPNNPNDFYFLTTEGGETSGEGLDARDGGGLWRLSFENIERPSQGATLTLLLDGSESLGADEPKMNKPDNMTIDSRGNLLIQEDPGGNNHLARILAYRIDDGALGVVARFDAALFGPGATEDPHRLTIDEESSGIIDTERLLGRGTFVFDAQIHTAKGLPEGTGPDTVQEYVERGQLLVMKVRNWDDIYGD
ncbi:MAG: DUF839 domain-containing protein [Chloroflexi bacterium]|nr:DUF839 domain-containing protein [Chloroflexota bacterium]